MTKSQKHFVRSRKPKSLYSAYPWEYRHQKDCSEIVAYAEGSGKWETVLVVHPTSGISAENMAVYIVTLINDRGRGEHILRFMLSTLELVLGTDGKLDFTSEQDIEKSVQELKNLIG